MADPLTLEPPLVGQLDAHDRRMLREWLEHSCDVTYAQGTDDESEAQYASTPSVSAQRCFINTASTRRLVLPTGEVRPVDVEVIFDAAFALEEDDRLTNGLSRNGLIQFFGEVRVASVDRIPHPDKGQLVTLAMCLKH